MESTFSRSVGEGPTSFKATTSTFDRNTYAQELNDAYSSIVNFKQAQNETVRQNLISSGSDTDYCLLKPHELFPGFTVDKPNPCKRLPNMSRDIEQFTSAESTHYVGRSYDKVQQMLYNENWEALFDFSYQSWLEIVKELFREMDVENEFLCADVPLLLEHGVVKGVISYPEMYEILSLNKIAEKRNLLPTFTQTHDYYRLAGAVQKKYDYDHDNVVL